MGWPSSPQLWWSETFVHQRFIADRCNQNFSTSWKQIKFPPVLQPQGAFIPLVSVVCANVLCNRIVLLIFSYRLRLENSQRERKESILHQQQGINNNSQFSSVCSSLMSSDRHQIPWIKYTLVESVAGCLMWICWFYLSGLNSFNWHRREPAFSVLRIVIRALAC